MGFCKYCGREFSSVGLGGHTTHCKLNPTRVDMGKHKRPPLSDAHKKKLSESRKKFLNENPDKVPYRLYHSSKMSYPEQFFKDALERRKIYGWSYNFQNGRYSYDFAFPDLKIDVEIDGATHHLDKVKAIDNERDEFSKSLGWRVFRVTAQSLYGNADAVIDDLIKFCDSDRIFQNIHYVKKKKEKSLPAGVKLKEKNALANQKIAEQIKATDIDFSKLGWDVKVAEFLKMPSRSAKRWLKKNMYDVYSNAAHRKYSLRKL